MPSKATKPSQTFNAAGGTGCCRRLAFLTEAEFRIAAGLFNGLIIDADACARATVRGAIAHRLHEVESFSKSIDGLPSDDTPESRQEFRRKLEGDCDALRSLLKTVDASLDDDACRLLMKAITKVHRDPENGDPDLGRRMSEVWQSLAA